jgi:drug/metabolite transporter (DMT)-like permease
MENKTGKSVILGAILIGISATFWGFDGIVLTPSLYNLPVAYVVFILHLVPFLIMNMFLYNRYKNIKLLNKTEFYSLLMVALFGGSIGTLAIVKALFLVNFQSLSIVVLLQKLQPVFAISLAAIFLKEKLRTNFIIWAAIAVVAGYFLTFGTNLPHFQEDKNTIYASLFAVLAAFSFGSSTVFSKKVLGKLDFISTTFFPIWIYHCFDVYFGNIYGFIRKFLTNDASQLVDSRNYCCYYRKRGYFSVLLWIEKCKSHCCYHYGIVFSYLGHYFRLCF